MSQGPLDQQGLHSDSPLPPQKSGSHFGTFGVIAVAGVCILFFCVAMPVLVLLPAINAARKAARRNGCTNNARQISMGCDSYEAQYGVWQMTRTVPGRLEQAPPGTVGDDVSSSSDHSFLTRLLPFFEENILLGEIRSKSENFTRSPFDPEVLGSFSSPPYSTIDALICPTFSGAKVVDEGNTEYAQLNTTLGLTNYMALTGTHIDENGKVVENGVLVSVCSIDDDCNYKGHSVSQIGDGTSNTIIVCESRETQYAAWADSQATWVVGIDASAGISGVGTPNVQASAHFINVGGSSNYLTPGKGWGGKVARQWGPSSEHAGNVVIHTFADYHTKALSQNIDPTLYYKLITRNGGEAVVRPR